MAVREVPVLYPALLGLLGGVGDEARVQSDASVRGQRDSQVVPDRAAAGRWNSDVSQGN
jgi:hypothetical protein